MKVAVKDANVLIDLVEGDLLGLWFRLGIETHCQHRSGIHETLPV
jgi:hypothetical protein